MKRKHPVTRLSKTEGLALLALCKVTEALAAGKWAEVRDESIRLAALAADEATK
jgi:hypothetical protein